MPYQFDNGYFPYNYKDGYDPKGEWALHRDDSHAVTVQVLSSLLACSEWSSNADYVEAMRRGVAYIKTLDDLSGKIDGEPNVHTLAEWQKDAKGWPGLITSPWEQTADSALINARIHRYLGNEKAFEQAASSLRWLHHNAPLCIPFLPGDDHIGMWYILTENGYSHAFRQAIMTAYEGFHLRRKGIKDVAAIFVKS